MKRFFRSPGMRNFDPRAVGSLECRAWEMYYRRKWLAVLVAFVGLIRSAFGMSWPRTLQGAWYVLRANQKWAPFPDNDPDAAREYMRRFYALLAAAEHATFDPVRAAELEVEWWRAHREDQHGGGSHAARAVIRGAVGCRASLSRGRRTACWVGEESPGRRAWMIGSVAAAVVGRDRFPRFRPRLAHTRPSHPDPRPTASLPSRSSPGPPSGATN